MHFDHIPPAPAFLRNSFQIHPYLPTPYCIIKIEMLMGQGTISSRVLNPHSLSASRLLSSDGNMECVHQIYLT